MVVIAILGNVDAGKSSLIGVLKTGKADDGRGTAREKILVHKHEKETGRTTSIGVCRLNQSNDIVLLDLAGHTKYLRNTLLGLTGYDPNFAMIIIECGKALTTTTIHHYKYAKSLEIPIIFVFTKIDVVNNDIIKEKYEELKQAIKIPGEKRKLISTIRNEEQLKIFLDNYHNIYERIIPAFQVSNVTLENIELLRHFLSKLQIIKPVREVITHPLFYVRNRYRKPGIGTIVFGENVGTPIRVGNSLYLVVSGTCYNFIIKSIHDDNQNNLTCLGTGHYGCLALNLKEKLSKRQISISNYIIANPVMLVAGFRASIWLFSSSVTIRRGYTASIYFNAKATAKITEIENADLIRSDQMCIVTFKFLTKQVILPNEKIFIFDGALRACGIVLETIALL